MLCISLRLTRINAAVLNIATMDHFLQCQVSKNSLRKGYIEMLKSYFLETLKRVLGRSINHYSFCWGRGEEGGRGEGG